MIKILFAGGGTGGHIYPILAVAEELQKISIERKIGIELYYFGAPQNYQPLLAQNGIFISKIFSAKLRRYFDFRNFLDIPFFFLSVFQALWKVFFLMPDALFSKGGPGSLPIVFACWFYHVPVIIHESDSVLGLANKLAVRFAYRIGISFASTAKLSFGNKIALIGNPVRRSLIENSLEQGSAKRIFGFNEQKPLIFAIGGSQGAIRINDFILNASSGLVKNWQILHQTGVNNFNDVKSELSVISKNWSEENKNSYRIVPYLEKDLKDAYAAADIVVSRAGSGSIFEIAAFNKPAILIPLPEAAADHQTANAYEYAKGGAAIVIEQANLGLNVFLTQLEKLFSENKLTQMSLAAKKFAKPEAAKIIAEELIKLGNK
ncbi:MAG: UDP-N-acetylglucosamine--N-acetylmuramyl-(pentapeptide) pyrophosphoryl-undecaprenol N-acetylglucosamine transferase [Patescibacteria group bacterium]